jgi:hypothetical protein
MALLVAAVAPGASIAAPAKVINGTAGNDVLRGTGAVDTINGKAGNDKIYGLAGNDQLSGGPGNDVIVGGPGADVITCGPGTDTVFADPTDTISPDCETVHGAATLATAGHYVGKTSQGSLIGFDVADDGKTISDLVVFANAHCSDIIVNHFGTTLNALSVNAQGAFTTPVPTSAAIVGGTIRGSFDATHAASGTFQLDFSDPLPGNTCSTGQLSWTAQPTPLLLLPGHYTGATDLTGRSTVSFDVGTDGRTVSNFTVATTFSCQPSSTFTGRLGPLGVFAPLTGRTLVVNGGNQNPTSGSPYTISLTINFDPAGYFTGTTQVRTQPTSQGVQYDCDSGQLNWQGGIDTPP